MSDTSTSDRRRRRRIVVALAIGLLLVGEVAARGLRGSLPDPLVWHTREAQAKVDRMDQLGHADVVTVGSSLVAFGVDVARLQDRLGVVAYNAGLTAGIPELTARWTVEVVLPRLDPDLLVVGVGSFDFTDHPSGEVFRDAYLDSTGGRRAGDERDLLNDASWWVAEHSALWDLRSQLRQPDVLWRALTGASPEVDPEVSALTPGGRNTSHEDVVFDPDAPGAPGLPVSSWTLGSRQPTALRQLVETAAADGIDVVLVTMPTTDTFVARHPQGATDHDTYVAAARAMAGDLGIPLVRFDDLRDPDLFLDMVHLNRDGARTFTDRLADELAGLDEVRTGSR